MCIERSITAAARRVLQYIRRFHGRPNLDEHAFRIGNVNAIPPLPNVGSIRKTVERRSNANQVYVELCGCCGTCSSMAPCLSTSSDVLEGQNRSFTSICLANWPCPCRSLYHDVTCQALNRSRFTRTNCLSASFGDICTVLATGAALIGLWRRGCALEAGSQGSLTPHACRLRRAFWRGKAKPTSAAPLCDQVRAVLWSTLMD